ncbi:hypothetical protein C0991_003304 [Blastosporella zonata]|nr:hypothetical protein C0991_003304 [Blastosporella zonata]
MVFRMLPAIHQVLSRADVQQIVQVHPNDPAADDFGDSPPWQDIVADYHSTSPHNPLLAAIRNAQLPRQPIPLPLTIPQSSFGMSPKKYHEVSRMTQYIANLGLPANVHIVDVGAGQGYLTRALHAHFGTPALALDNDHVQTHGSQARGGPKVTGITHRTIHLTPDTLVSAIDDWVPSTPTPVLLVALHACGSLTPDLFRAALSLSKAHQKWYPAAIVAVGCCYNLMCPPNDFPLHNLNKNPLPSLPASAYQMAAQIPDTWLLSPQHLERASLSIRKVVWRALLGRLFDASSANVTGTGSTPTMRRLGRLHDSAYDSWDAFIRVASQRIGVDLSSTSDSSPVSPLPSSNSQPPNPALQARLASLHVLRCLLGPVIESYIILDRLAWLQHQLQSPLTAGALEGYSVEAVNLFDQATGSGRNVALVVRPG